MTDTQQDAGAFHPRRGLYRFTMLLFIASLSFGSYFAYDIIGAIAPSLMEKFQAARTIGAFNTMYSVAAVIVTLLGGLLIDRLGTRRASLLFSLLVFGGALIVWRGESLALMFLGRFIFGAGSEPLIVAQSTMLARWFKNKELALSFGLTLTVSRIGSLFAFNTGELFAQYFGSFRYALLAAVIACGLSLLGNILYVVFDRRAEKALELRDESAGDKIVFRDIVKFKPSFWFVTFLCFTFYAAIFPFQSLSTQFFAEKWNVIRAHDTAVYSVYSNEATSRLSDVELKAPSRLMSSSTAPGEMAVSWTDNSSDETGFILERRTAGGEAWSEVEEVGPGVTTYQDKDLEPGRTYEYRVRAVKRGAFLAQVFNNFLHMFTTAGGITSIIIFASMLLAPFAGGLVDRIGRRATLMIIGSLILIPSHLLMGLTKLYPAFPMIALGMAFVLVPAAMWPAVPLIVPKERTGTAFGLMTAIQNIGLGLFPLLNGVLRDVTGGFLASQFMFAALGIVGLVFAFLLKRSDAREGGGLERNK